MREWESEGLDEHEGRHAAPSIFHSLTHPLSHSATQVAVVVWLAILVVVSMRGFMAPRAHSVYPIFADAARHWLAGADLYRPTGEPFRYSPLVAAFLVPLSLLPDSIGGVFWRLLNAGVYLGALLWWCRAVLPWPLTRPQTALLFLLIVPLSIGSLNNGQSNALVLGLLLATMAGVACERWNLAAGCLALACLFKVYPIAVGLLLTVVYGWRFGGRLLLALGLGLALPFLLQEPEYVSAQYLGWCQHLQTNDRHSLQPDLWYRDLQLLCHTCNLTLGPKIYMLIQLLTGAAFAGICVLIRWHGRGERACLILLQALGCCWMTLFGPATESCTYILVAPSLAWALLDAWSGPLLVQHFAGHARRAGLLTSFTLFVVAQAAVWFPGGGRPLHALGIQPLATLLFLVCQLLWELRVLFVPARDKDLEFARAHAA